MPVTIATKDLRPHLGRKIDRIMVAVGSSLKQSAALRFAASLAREVSARVYIVHVITPGTLAFAPPGAMDNVATLLKEREERELAAVAAMPGIRDVVYDTISVIGPLEQTIAELVRKNDINLLVVDSAGRRGFRRFLYGSLAEQILRTVTCPVIAIGPRAKSRMNDSFVVRKILVATDFEPHSKTALGYATWLASNESPTITLLHVIDSHPAGGQSRKETALWRLVPERIADRTLIEFNCLVKTGDPAKTILSVAKQMRADLIVLGARTSRWTALFSPRALKAISAMVVAGAHCPVLTMHRKAKSRHHRHYNR